MLKVVLALLAIGSWGNAAFAEDQLQGVAFAQAPEAGLGVCFGVDAAETMDCAQQACVAESGLGAEDCVVSDWCFPARWSGDVFVQHVEGLHWHDFACGWDTREQLEAAMAVGCDADYIAECDTVRVWDAAGTQIVGETTGQ
ncbi:MAG: hypothetical protein JWR75_772 [Devosia sp.]|nr:hypothetical protein [Devosia sp.]